MCELKSNTIKMRLIKESDASFILSLRTDERYNQYLSPVKSDFNEQVEWIKKYKVLESKREQFYFIIETLDSTPCGTVRIYDLKEDSFCWGSWILNENKTKYAALESAYLVYRFGFDSLMFKKSHFDVRKGNKKVIDFHEKFGAIKVGEDDENYYYEITKEDVEKTVSKFARIVK